MDGNPLWVVGLVFSVMACGSAEEHAVLKRVAQVSIGPNHACARLEGGTVKCWGNNYSGQLGDGTTRDALTAIEVSGVTNAVTISAGGDESCAVLSDGSARCWGLTYSPSLSGTAFYYRRPTLISGIRAAAAISAGDYYHTCVLEADGSVQCWGSNSFGQLGNGTTKDSPIRPVQVSGLLGAVDVSAHGAQTCASLAGGRVQCWGLGTDGVVGNGALEMGTLPTEVAGLEGAEAVGVGDVHACARRTDGTVACWGRNGDFELGSQLAGEKSTSPVTVEGPSSVVSLSVGTMHSCAVTADGAVWCWGRNEDGELGTGEKSTAELPSRVRGLEAAESAGVGEGVSCAVLRDHTVRCWGRNTYGALGDGTLQESLTPVTVLEQ